MRTGVGCGVAVAAGLLLALSAGCAGPATAGAAGRRAHLDDLRRSAAADVHDRCRDSAANIGVSRKDAANPAVKHTEYGAAVVVHEAGYLLTNAHGLRHGGTVYVGLHGRADVAARIVAVDEGRDLAVLKIDTDPPPTPVRLGRSADLRIGEPVVGIGNPFGIGRTVAQGIVSALGRSTRSEFTFYPDMIQTDASVNPGSSGGPLLNVYGELVGINTTRKPEAENIAFAIPVDRIREALPEILAPEQRYGFVLGLHVAADGEARVQEVAPGSPAAAARVLPGDLVTRLGGRLVSGAPDFHLLLTDCRAGRAVRVGLIRGARALEVTLTPRAVEARPAETPTGLVPGLRREAWKGRWDRLPDFGTLAAPEVEKVATFDLGRFRGQDGFALRFTGYVEVPADGVYAFYVRSDDGSRLWIGDRLVVDNDGVHTSAEKRGFIPLRAGRHPVVVACFDRTEAEDLRVSWEGPGLAKQPVPAEALFRPQTP